MQRYSESRNIELVTSTPYHAQANGQVEASNKILIDLISKHTKQKPRNWNETLSQLVWAYTNSPKGATKTTLYRLVYGEDVVLPIEVNVQSLRVQRQIDFPL